MPEPSSHETSDPPDALPGAAPGLVLVSTPIGNLGDLSPRAANALREADLLLCEDTRTSATLLRAAGIARRAEALHDHNEAAMVPRVLARLRDGARVALISDAGTPLISDPGFRLVRAAIEAGVAVSAVPGPNAALMALTLSGLPPYPFLFLGFLPPKHAARIAAIERLRAAEAAGLQATLILHEAPHRLGETLADLAETLGDRPACVARELTKRFEEVRRGGLAALADGYRAEAPRGEITVVVGPGEAASLGGEAVDDLLRKAMEGRSVKEAVELVAASTGVARREVYRRAVEMKK